MTKEEKIEYTKNCLSLLGYVCVTPDDKDFRIYEGKNNVLPNMIDANFNDGFINNWNLIMEVVDAIEDIQIEGQYIYSIQPRGATCEIKCSTQYSLAFDVEMPCIYEIAKSKKEAIVQAINQFLIWYKK